MTKNIQRDFRGRTRREFLWEAGAGFGAAALTPLLSLDGFLARQATAAAVANPLLRQPPALPAKAKSVIHLFMYGGPSHIDTFDYKPRLVGMDGKTVAVKTFGRGGRKSAGRIVEPRWQFRQRGACGKWVSDLFPCLGECVDDIAFLHSMTAESPIHGASLLLMNTGRSQSGSPALGSWVSYGLGSPHDNLPAFVVLPAREGGPINGPKNWSSGGLPANCAGTIFRAAGSPPNELSRPAGTMRTDPAELAARIATHEQAYKLQRHAPEAADIRQETEATMRLYGIDREQTRDFGTRCLLARRLVERGVRFVQLYAGGGHHDNWDAHGDLVANHAHHAGATDQPIAGLLMDLKQRGLLEETLVLWGGEFGRQPTAEYGQGTGRDHNAYGFTMWLAGGGLKGGVSVGATDELGAAAVESPFHVQRVHATVLGQLGLDPNRLANFDRGLDHDLVRNIQAEPIREIIA